MVFLPGPGFSGDAGFVLIADDGYTQSASASIVVRVSAAPLLRIDFADRRPELALGNLLRPVVIGDFADQTGVVLPASYHTLSATNSTVASG